MGSSSSSPEDATHLPPLPVQRIVGAGPLSTNVQNSPASSLRDSSPRSVQMRKEKFPIICSDIRLSQLALVVSGTTEQAGTLTVVLIDKEVYKEHVGPGNFKIEFPLKDFPSNRVYFTLPCPVVIRIASGDRTLQIFCGFNDERTLQVKKKQAVISGQFLDIEHVYGLSDNSVCLICMQNIVSVALAPCRHACLCDDCASDFARTSRTICPVCRVPASGLLRLTVVTQPQE